jgi:hypothetical protein
MTKAIEPNYSMPVSEEITMDPASLNNAVQQYLGNTHPHLKEWAMDESARKQARQYREGIVKSYTESVPSLRMGVRTHVEGYFPGHRHLQEITVKHVDNLAHINERSARHAARGSLGSIYKNADQIGSHINEAKGIQEEMLEYVNGSGANYRQHAERYGTDSIGAADLSAYDQTLGQYVDSYMGKLSRAWELVPEEEGFNSSFYE